LLPGSEGGLGALVRAPGRGHPSLRRRDRPEAAHPPDALALARDRAVRAQAPRAAAGFVSSWLGSLAGRVLAPMRARISRRILRLGLLAGATAQQRTTPPDLQKASAVETPYGTFFIPE